MTDKGEPLNAAVRLQFSIVTVVKDDAAGLEHTLQSVALQTFSSGAFEVVIQDASASPLDDARRARLPSNHTYLAEADRGIYDGMNRGLARARGDYVIFLNAGDSFRTEDALSAIESIVGDAQPAWAVVSGVDLGGGVEPPRAVPARFRWLSFVFNRHALLHQACVFRRDVLMAAGGYDLSIPVVADYDLVLRVGLVSEPVLDKRVLINYAGGGLSDERRGEIPALKAEVRRMRLGLRGGLMLADQAYTVMPKMKDRVRRALPIIGVASK